MVSYQKLDDEDAVDPLDLGGLGAQGLEGVSLGNVTNW